ncbi:1-acyl-sn-glycerol-3-phosphate acyltransferase alpha isoform X2 [Dermacentor silvarum]|uniref:1-acyl-sn-glycerol-3-phosphate acyltransferase alpha isoform X2 n=1 Tax=Dermacentor silvarum TaxID=543639 RepID=UPI0021018712|nr:1-acyl-sn-glycerol-3-phosphate acyltransferase alpha isoform X2 [Dermacentor silvarum]
MGVGKVSCPWCVALGFAVVTVVVLVRRNQTFRYFFRLTTYYVLMSAVCALACVPSVFRPFDPANMVMISHGLRRLTWAIGVGVVLRHRERIPRDRRFILVVNHQSSLDVFGLLHFWREFHPCVPVMKRELLYTGPLGLACYLAGSVFLDRGNSQQSRRALNERLEDIKNGKAPVLPLVLSNYKSFFCSKERKFNNGTVKLTVLPVVSTDGMTTDDVTDLTKRIQSMMQDELDRQQAELEEARQLVPASAGVESAIVSDMRLATSATSESAVANKERLRDGRRTCRIKRSI